jgi:hypothetical protein
MVLLAMLYQLGIYFLANVHDVRAAGVEPASWRRMYQIRRSARYGGETNSLPLDAGKGFDQSLSVGMHWILEY